MNRMEEIIKNFQERVSQGGKLRRSSPMEEKLNQTMTSFKCPKCEDREIILIKDENGYEFARKCDCKAEREVERLLKNSLITESFQKMGFKNFNVTDHPPIIRTAFDTAKEYAQNFERIRNLRTNSIALLGRSGSGKTHLLTAVSNNLIRKRIKVLYFPFVEGFNDLKDNFDLLDRKIDRMKRVMFCLLMICLKAGKILHNSK